MKRKRANQSVASASSDRGLTLMQLCSIETHAIFSDFPHFQAGSDDFELVMVKLLKVTLVIRRGLKEMYILYLPKIIH